MSYATAFSYMERHDREYGARYVYPFVTEKLSELTARKDAFEQSHPNGVFDLDTVNERELCFYILRNLIGRSLNAANPDELLNDMRFLLSIPAVRTLAHQSVNNGQSNELLRLAVRLGNRDAAGLLLQIPAVRTLAEENDFYRTEAQGNLDLSALARDRESSMIALSQAETRLLNKVLAHYQPAIDELGGQDAVFQQLRSYLQSVYEANPATITVADRYNRPQTIRLPLEWDALQALRLSDAHHQAALKAYYQHTVHTCYRYLSKPNPWMADNASYVYVYEAAGQQTTYRYATFEEYLEIIVPFYLAASDEDSPPIDGYTHQDRIDAFIKQLALIGRAHNWDRSRVVMKDGRVLTDAHNNPVMEEYDDLTGDRPSCYSGVKRRLFQSVLGHTLFKPLNDTIVRQALYERIRAYYENIITADNAPSIKQAYEAFICFDFETISEDEATKTLQALDIQKDKQDHIIDEVIGSLADNFKEGRDAVESLFKAFLDRAFKQTVTSLCHFIAFDGACGLARLLDTQVEASKATTSSTPSANGMFASRPEDELTASEDEMHQPGLSRGKL